MFRVNVGLSRKLTRNYNSTGYSLNIEAEVDISLDDAEAVSRKIRELYTLAEASLRDQMVRDEKSASGLSSSPSAKGTGEFAALSHPADGNSQRREPPGAADAIPRAATKKQLRCLRAIASRHGLSPRRLDELLSGFLVRSTRLSDLSQAEAGRVIPWLVAEIAGRSESPGGPS